MDLFNGRSRNPTLKLATDRAPTRDNALAQAREQRAKRELEQRQRRCATKIQAAFRGHLSRRATTRDLAARAARLCSPSADTAGSAIRELALLASFVHLNTMNLHTRQGPFASLAADASRLTRQLALAISSWRTSDEQLKVLGSKSSSTALLHAANACDDNVLADDALLDRWRRCVAHHVASVPLTLMSAELEQRIVTCFLNRFGWSRTAELQWLRDIVERDGVMLPSSLAAVLTVPARAEEALAFVAPSASVLRAAFLGLASDTNFTQAIVQDKALLVALLRIGTGMLDKDVLIALIAFMDAQSSTLFTHLLTELGEPKSKQPGVRWVVEEGLSVLFDAVLPPQNVVAANFALSPLNSLCRALARPYAAHVSVSVKNRSQAVPYISALAYHRYGLINKLLGAIRATSRQWALKDRSGALVLGYPYMVVLFSHLCRAYLTTSDLEEFQTLIGGVETLRYLVHMLRDTVFLALYNGHAGSDASDTSPAAEASTLFVAASVQLLSMLHAADEPMGLMGPDDWLRKDFRPPSQVNVTLYDEVAAATRRYQSLAANPDGTSEDSDEDARRGPNVGHAPRASANANNNENALSILHLAPFIVPFEHRVAVFATLLFEDRLNEPYSNREVVVRRGHEFMDTVGAINIDQHPREIMAVGNVRFVDALGRNEAGYGRGVFRDWLRATVENGFNVSVGLYREDHAKTLEPNPHVQSIVDGSPLPLYTALGLLLGRAIRDGVLVDVPLSSHVRNLILGRTNTIFDLRAYDAELYRHLTDLKNGRFSPEEVNSMGLTFTHVDNVFGEIRETPLKKNGAEVAVTPENVVEYVHLLTDFILNRRTARAVQAFRAGLHAAVPEHWLHFFDSREFLTLIRGQDDDHPLDVADWRKHTEYDGFTDQDPLAHIFWTAVERMTPQQQRQLLHFATSATRAPLLGFSQLHPRFRLLASQEDVAHLPTAATCFCTLRIPKYTSVDQALEKLVQAATNCTTFEMS